MRASLLKAYRETSYEVRGVAVRIGRRCRALDELLVSRRAREAAFITAYNPFSCIRAPGWNQRMQRQLAGALHRRPMTVGKGSWRRWSEVHLVVFGDAKPMVVMARRFRQHGIVTVRLRHPARLVMTSRLDEPSWAGLVTAAKVTTSAR